MYKDIDLNRSAILIDFDGTITTEDTNDKIFKVYGSKNRDEIRAKFKEDKLSFPQYFQTVMGKVRLTEEEYKRFLLEEIELSPGFLEFYKKAKERSIKIGIISGGFENGIIPFLEKYGIDDIDIFANKLVFQGDRPSIEFLDGQDTQCCPKGPCGNCKIKHYYEYKEENKNIIFIGDGLTDMPVANLAEIVFAKDSLATYLDEKDIPYIAYEDFNDINKILFK